MENFKKPNGKADKSKPKFKAQNREFRQLLKRYDYQLSRELIATKPASPRDSARLLVYKKSTGALAFDTVKNLGKFLPEGAVLVFNQTKVLPARFLAFKPTGGKLKLLFTRRSGGNIKALCEKKLDVGWKLSVTPKTYFTVMKKEAQEYALKPSFPAADIYKFLYAYGEAPVPPYLKHTPLKGKRLSGAYQTIFAKNEGSVAAPTASLHFTKRLLHNLRNSGFGVSFVTLHVGLGTFAPLTVKNLQTGVLHQEYFEIGKKTAKELNCAKVSRRPIIAVGTTVARTLESAQSSGKIEKLSGTTDLFIKEGYGFRFVDGLLTNFHVPKSSLLMLVSAMIGRKPLLRLYNKAKEKKFRFFSFGDAMLILDK